jgi:hypothetical protein
MNINTLTNYVNQEVDDTFTVQEISLWFNRGISNYNLIPPLTVYPLVQFGVVENIAQGVYSDQSQYPLEDTFMLAVMAPYITSSVRSSESSLTERQLFLQEFTLNAASFKSSIGVPLQYMRNQKNTNLDIYEIGEGVFLSDFTQSPFAGEWQQPSLFKEVVIDKTDLEEE